mmetsp:Transcript_16417/g.29155  ORF Transcript_16417/g.29155 Transcript_16417/m.29155 type:complete len:106 (+) Transcript_16417:386-703(+)
MVAMAVLLEKEPSEANMLLLLLLCNFHQREQRGNERMKTTRAPSAPNGYREPLDCARHGILPALSTVYPDCRYPLGKGTRKAARLRFHGCEKLGFEVGHCVADQK